MKKFLLIAVGVFLLFAQQRYCSADGLIFPVKGGTEPQLARQRAIIVYRDGVKRLIVESGFEGEVGDYAFILPVPSEPLEIKKASYPLFKTLFYDFGEKAFEAYPAVFFYIIPLGLLALLTLLWSFLLLKGKCGLIATFLPLLPAGILLAIGVGCFQATIYHVPPPWVPGVSPGQGDAPPTDLAPADADALDSWLESGGFRPLAPDEKRIVKEYIAQGWRFVAGKMHKPSQGLSAPGPFDVAFKTAGPVFPACISSPSGGPESLNLIVIADKSYDSPKLETEFTNRMAEESFHGKIFYTADEWDIAFSWAPVPGWNDFPIGLHKDPGMLDRGIVHSEADSLLWNCCIVSKMHGAMPSEWLGKDFRATTLFHGKTRLLVTSNTAAVSAVFYGLLFFSTLTFAATVALAIIRRLNGVSLMAAGSLYLVLFAVSAAAWFGVWQTTPTAAASGSIAEVESAKLAKTRSAFQSLCSVPDGPADKLLVLFNTGRDRWPEISDTIREQINLLAEGIRPVVLESGARNSLTREPLTVEESPGNLWFSFGTYGDYLSLRVYDSMHIYFREKTVESFSHKRSSGDK
ncbi:MAG: DUF2330 domain-containing protein [Candidatus Brocadiia bacterium]